jgi:uncharacterized membrane protein YwaF
MSAFIQSLDKLLEATAWEMNPPPAYGVFHLSFTFIGVFICILFARKLRNLSERGHKIVLGSVGGFLALTEIYKQLFYCFYMSNNTYVWWIFPFQLCSVPMYLCIIAIFLKPGPVRNGVYGFMTTYNLLGGIMAFIEPSGITHGYWTLTLHAYIWHMLLIFIGVYLIMSEHFAKTRKDYFHATLTFLALCAVAFTINVIFWNASEGTINMFFVGPKNSSLAVFKDIAQNFGWYVSTALYIPTVMLGAFLVYLPAHIYAKKKAKKEQARCRETMSIES